MKIHSKEIRKENTKQLINFISNYLYSHVYPNNTVNGFIVLFFHWAIVGSALVYILLGEVNTTFFICISIWILIFVMHMYFHGCILTKIEKQLWQAKDWCGPWSLPFKLLEDCVGNFSQTTRQNIYYGWAIALSGLMLFKISKKYLLKN